MFYLNISMLSASVYVSTLFNYFIYKDTCQNYPSFLCRIFLGADTCLLRFSGDYWRHIWGKLRLFQTRHKIGHHSISVVFMLVTWFQYSS